MLEILGSSHAVFITNSQVSSYFSWLDVMTYDRSKLYLSLVLIILLIQLFFYIPLYHYWGLRGLGISYIMNGVISLILYGGVLYKKYRVSLNGSSCTLIFIVVSTLALTLFARNQEDEGLSILMGGLLFVGSSIFTCFYLKTSMGIDVMKIIKARIRINNIEWLLKQWN